MPAPVTPGFSKIVSACGGLYLLDTGSVTPDSIRGRYDDARSSALIPKLTDNLDQLFSPGMSVMIYSNRPLTRN